MTHYVEETKTTFAKKARKKTVEWGAVAAAAIAAVMAYQGVAPDKPDLGTISASSMGEPDETNITPFGHENHSVDIRVAEALEGMLADNVDFHKQWMATINKGNEFMEEMNDRADKTVKQFPCPPGSMKMEPVPEPIDLPAIDKEFKITKEQWQTQSLDFEDALRESRRLQIKLDYAIAERDKLEIKLNVAIDDSDYLAQTLADERKKLAEATKKKPYTGIIMYTEDPKEMLKLTSKAKRICPPCYYVAYDTYNYGYNHTIGPNSSYRIWVKQITLKQKEGGYPLFEVVKDGKVIETFVGYDRNLGGIRQILRKHPNWKGK